MLKNILIKCAELLNRNDITKALKTYNNISDISDEFLQSDIYRMITYVNFMSNTIFENYFDLTYTERLTSDTYNKIYYDNFTHTPVKVLEVENGSGQTDVATVLSGYILTDRASSSYIVTYSYLPASLNNLNDTLNFPKEKFSKIICYGVVSEFFACKNQYEQSEFWKNRFMYEVFKYKTKKERRLKSVYKL